jgi:hypothetical protein
VVADTAAAVTLAAVTLVEATLAAVTSASLTSAEAGPMCTLVGPMFTSLETTASGITAPVGLVDMAGTMDSMTPVTRTGGRIRTATGRELKQIGVSHGDFGVARTTEVGSRTGREVEHLPPLTFSSLMRAAEELIDVR